MTLTELAKEVVENYTQDRKIIFPGLDLPTEFLDHRAGTFVTIEKNNELRGCIGSYLPTRKNIAEEIIHNAIAATTEDYRFEPIQEKELPQLSYTVYILSQPELIKNIKELDPKKYGIIIKTETKTGLLLPDLESIDRVEQQIAIACQKAGIDPKREKILIHKFTVEKYK